MCGWDAVTHIFPCHTSINFLFCLNGARTPYDVEFFLSPRDNMMAITNGSCWEQVIKYWSNRVKWNPVWIPQISTVAWIKPLSQNVLCWMDVQNESSLTRGDIFSAGVKKGEKWDFIHLQQDTGRGDKTLTCAHCVYTIFPCVMSKE